MATHVEADLEVGGCGIAVDCEHELKVQLEACERHANTRVRCPRKTVLEAHCLELRRQRWIHPDFHVSLLHARLQLDPSTERNVFQNAE